MPYLRKFDFLKWFYPGMHIKRWLFLLMLGVTLMGLGFAYVLRHVYVSYTFPDVFYYITLQFIPQIARGALFMGVALSLILFAMWKLSHSLFYSLLPHRHENGESLVNIIYNRRYLSRGPKIVAIGGGTGLSNLLRGLKEHTTNLTAIVTVADDGGSSGRLREELGILPPGDVRNCIAALADVEPLMSKLFQYRFSQGSGLAGHSFGNLFIVAMSGIVGNFEEAVRQTSRVLAVRGQIIPSTLTNVTLYAQTNDAGTIRGESNISQTQAKGHIKDIYLVPSNPPAYPEAVRAILDADMIVLGPGSLYTSLLPNLLVEGIRRAISASPALKIYVCNVATQPGETDDFGVAEHLAAIEEHIGHGLIQYVLANDNVEGVLLKPERSQPVQLNMAPANGVRIILSDVVSQENRYRHDSTKLAQALLRTYEDRHQLGQTQPEAEERLAAAISD